MHQILSAVCAHRSLAFPSWVPNHFSHHSFHTAELRWRSDALVLCPPRASPNFISPVHSPCESSLAVAVASILCASRINKMPNSNDIQIIFWIFSLLYYHSQHFDGGFIVFVAIRSTHSHSCSCRGRENQLVKKK